MKESNFCIDFFPRNKYGNNSQKKSKQQHKQTQSVQCQMYSDTKLWNPVGLNVNEPFGVESSCLEQEQNHQRQVNAQCHQRNNPWQNSIPISCQPCQKSARQKNYYEINQYHLVNIKVNMKAIPIANESKYHLSFPFWAMLRK